ncbi:MAG: hypothetical protein V4463_05270 [Pseudomonadota bacterium]
MNDKLKKAIAWLGDNIDMRDRLVFGGLAFVCYGVALVYPPLAWIVGGAGLMWLGLN